MNWGEHVGCKQHMQIKLRSAQLPNGILRGIICGTHFNNVLSFKKKGMKIYELQKAIIFAS